MLIKKHENLEFNKLNDFEPRIIHFQDDKDEEGRLGLRPHRGKSIEDEVQLLTLKDFGPTVRVRYGGLVTARSVKYLGKLKSNLSDQGMNML